MWLFSETESIRLTRMLCTEESPQFSLLSKLCKSEQQVETSRDSSNSKLLTVDRINLRTCPTHTRQDRIRVLLLHRDPKAWLKDSRMLKLATTLHQQDLNLRNSRPHRPHSPSLNLFLTLLSPTLDTTLPTSLFPSRTLTSSTDETKLLSDQLSLVP